MNSWMSFEKKISKLQNLFRDRKKNIFPLSFNGMNFEGITINNIKINISVAWKDNVASIAGQDISANGFTRNDVTWK